MLTLDAEAGHGAEILIETSSGKASFVALGPSGEQLQRINSDQPEWLVLEFPCAQRGRYQLIAQVEDAQEARSGVSLHADYLPFVFNGNHHRTQAANLFSDAQSLALSPHAAPLRAAIVKYQQIAAAWGAVGDRDAQLLALTGEARAWLNLSRYDNALAAINRARLLNLHTLFFRAKLADLESEVYLDRWDSVLAKRFAEEGLRLSRTLADPWLAADAFADRAEAEYLTDDLADRADIEQALTLSRQSDAEETLARALRCKSWMVGDEGHVTHAMTFMRQAEAGFRTAGEVRNAVDAMANLATIQGMNGDHYAALIGHSRLIPLIRESGKFADLAFLLVNTADDYMELNRVPDAIAYYQEARGIFRKIGLLAGESIGVSQLCMAETRANRLREAMQDCLQSKDVAEQLRDPKRLGITIWRVGKVQRALGRTVRAIASFREAYEISGRAQDPRSQAQALMEWGDALETLGNREQAREMFLKALPLSQQAEAGPEQLEARYRIARSELEAGEDKAAESDLVAALHSINTQRRAVTNADLRASYFAEMSKCHELYVDLLMRRYERDPLSGSAERALEVSESGRARALLDTLSAHSRISSLPQLGRPQKLLEMQIAVERAYDERLKLMLEGAKKRDLDANEAVLTEAIDMLERTEDERRAESASDIPAGIPLKASEIAAASRDLNFTLVGYALGADHSYVWFIDHGKIESHVLPARKIIESAVKEWRTLATARISRPGATFDEVRKRIETADLELPRVGAGLSCMLLSPFLKPSMDHLAIVPDGELALLPFAALPENGCDGGAQPLVASRQIVLVPSLSILFLPHKLIDHDSWRGEIALLADPVFDAGDPRVHRTDSSGTNDADHYGPALPRLYGTRDEAMAIATLAGPNRSALYLDFDANLQTLLDPSLRQYRVLHLATHGVLDEDAPGLSGIVLSLVNRKGQPVFGFLKRDDVENLNLRSDLVVLSSCDSGSGLNLSGEGVMGLNYAFLSAGATRVLSTLWSVDDETSTELMIAFYSAMFHDGLNPTEALRRSQMKLMQNDATSAPYHWAGFTIISTVIH